MCLHVDSFIHSFIYSSIHIKLAPDIVGLLSMLSPVKFGRQLYRDQEVVTKCDLCLSTAGLVAATQKRFHLLIKPQKHTAALQPNQPMVVRVARRKLAVTFIAAKRSEKLGLPLTQSHCVKCSSYEQSSPLSSSSSSSVTDTSVHNKPYHARLCEMMK